MSAKEVFEKKSKKVLKSSNPETLGQAVESHRYVEAYIKDKDRFIPRVDYEDPSEFAKCVFIKIHFSGRVRKFISSLTLTYSKDNSHGLMRTEKF